jgi:hypothetical protein
MDSKSNQTIENLASKEVFDRVFTSHEIIPNSEPKLNIREHNDIEKKKFEYESIMMEIKRIEEEERELLGLRKGEKLSIFHYDDSIDQENEVYLKKRSESSPMINMQNRDTDNFVHESLDSERSESKESTLDYSTFKELFMMMENSTLVENFERLDHLEQPICSHGVFLKLIKQYLH